jgi:hypothetical protein
MKEAIDQALVDADKMDAKLAGLIQKEEGLIKMQSIAGSTTQQVLGIAPGSKEEIADLQQHSIWMEKAVSLEQQLGESKSFTAVEQGKLTELQKKQAEYEAATRGLSGNAQEDSFLARKIQAAEIILADTQKETISIQEQIRLRDAQQTHEQLTGAGKGGRGKATSDNMPEQIAHARIEAMHAADAQLPVEQEIIAAMDKQVELNNLKANTSKEGTAAERETLRVLENQLALSKAKEQIDTLGKNRLNVTFEAQQKEDEAARKRQEEQARAQLEETNRVREETISAGRETAAALIEAANQEFERTQLEIRGQEELGRISHRVAEQRLLDALRLREATTQGALKTEQGLFNPVAGQKEAIEYKKLEDQMTKEAQRAALERERIVQQEATKMEQVYKRVATEFNSDFTRAFNEWATKSKTAGQAFGKMLGDMELQVIDFVAKSVLEHAEMWIELKIMNALGVETMETQNAVANMKAVTQDAKTAAANAYKWASSWGGPPAGAIAAAVAFTAVEAFGTFDTGGMMPHMGMAFNTSGSVERVLSPSQTSNFESLVNNGGSRSAHLHQTNNFGGGVSEKMLADHTAKTMNKLRSMIRPEALA